MGTSRGATFADAVVLFLPALVIYSIFTELDGYVVGALITEVAAGAYLVTMWTTKGGQTVGNRVAITRVRDASTGKRIAGLQAFRSSWRSIARSV
ncbi:MAG: RDD family protein [Acidimicrobiales bacterium]